MDTQAQNPELLDFFRALADENRLKIVGLLAQKPSSVTELAQALGLSVSTTSNHLSSLAYAGLVKAQPDGHYFIYSLQMETIRNMAKHLLQEENLPRLSEGQGEDAFERKVLNTFLNREGRIKVFPAQEKKFLVLLRHVLKSFEPGRRYTEQEVNEILLAFNADTASIRRGFIEYKMMAREGGGGAYWRIDQ
jgi:predicted transcriptional regulator